MQNNFNQGQDNSDVWFDVYGAEGDMQPEEIELRRKQAQINALRERGMESQEGKMVGNTYVAPSFTQYAAQLANAYMGRKGQEGVDVKEKELGTRRGAALRSAGDTIRERQAAANNSPLLAPGENKSLTPEEANRRRLMAMLSGGRGY
jgi:hypothetical protein